MKKQGLIVLLFTCMAISSGYASAASVAGFVHTEVPSNGMALVSVPFVPFGEGLFDDVLAGGLTGDDNPFFADAMSFWLNDSQAMTNAWLAAFINGTELNGHWVVGTSSTNARPFDLSLSCGDAFFIHNRQSSPAHVFVSGFVPLETSRGFNVFPGLNLRSFAYPSSGSATNALFDGMQDHLSAWDSATQSYLQTSNGVIALGEGFWAQRTATNAVVWTQPRPFAGAFNGSGLYPRISQMAFDTAAPSASLNILSDPSENARIDILSLNVGRYGDFSLSGWSHADRIASLGYASFSWPDALPGLFTTNLHARFYIVGDGDLDSDGDGLSDVLEMHVYGTNPSNPDTDGDGVADGAEVAAGSNPLLTDTPTLYSFCEGFETNTVIPGDIDGQNGWSTSQTGVGIVQTNDFFAGIASLKVKGGNVDEDISVSRSFTNAPEVVWFDLRQKLVVSTRVPDEPGDAAMCFFFDSTGHMVVLDGRNPSGSKWVVLSNTPALEEMAWVRISARLDYLTRTYDMYLNGVIVAENLGFSSDAPSLSSLSIKGAYGFYDNISMNSKRPSGLSSDWDALPDEWEVETFGSLTQTGSADPDGDGLDNADEYALGTDPLSNDSDADGMTDGWETANGFDPESAADATLDPDGDGLTNVTEQQLGTDPNAFDLDPRVRQSGLRAEFYATASTLTAIPDMDALLIRDLLIAPQINYSSTTSAWENVDASLKDNFASRMTGYIQAPANGTYTFHLSSDAGAVLRIGGAVVVTDSSSHTLRTVSGTVTLTKGFHPITVEYFEKTLSAALVLEWNATIYPAGNPVTLARAVVPASAFWHLPFGNEPPCATLAAAETEFVEGNTIAMSATSWDVDGDVVELQFCANGTTLFATNAASGSFVWTNAPAGLFDLTSVAIDDFGGASTSMPVTATVAHTPNGYETTLNAAFYDFNTTLTVFPVLNTTAVVSRLDEKINYPDTTSPWTGLPASMMDTFASVHSGYLFAPESGLYTLSLSSDDGSMLWLDGSLVIDFNTLHSMTEKSVTLPLAQGFHPILVKYFENGGSAGLILKWTPPGFAKQVIPSRCFFRLTGIADADSDGMEDWWELLQGFNPLDPSDASPDPDGDTLSNLQEFLAGTNPFVSDTDGDGIPDDWELANGMVPYVFDTAFDYDGDGLTNYEEYLAGTDIILADTDGDGFNDWFELRNSHTNPLVADVFGNNPIPIGDSVSGSQCTTNSGAWSSSGTTLYARERSGSVTYTLTVTNPAPNALAVNIEQFNALTTQTAFDLSLAIDGVFISRYVTDAPHGSPQDVLFFLPDLEAGAHTFKITWHNWRNNSYLAIHSLRFLMFDGPDADNNGTIDWIDNRAAYATTVEDLPLTSLVSPLCVEGTDFWRDVLEVSARYPTNTAVYPVVPTIGEGFYVDVPLDEEGESVIVSLDDRGDHSFPVAWEALNVFDGEFAEAPLAIRQNDSLRLSGTSGVETVFTVYRAGATNNWLAVTNFVSSIPVPYTFEDDGAFMVQAETTNGQAVAYALIDVTESAFAFSNPAVVMGTARVWPCPALSPDAVLEHDSAMTVSAEPLTTGGVKLTMLANKDRDHGLVSRLGEEGPVLDAAQVQPVWGDNGSYYHVLSNYADGSQLIEVVLQLGAIPEGLSVKLEIFVAGVYFEDGTRIKILTAADFDEIGCIRLRFLRSANIKSSVCHKTSLYQDGVLIGSNR